jgi:hypothetical protein
VRHRENARAERERAKSASGGTGSAGTLKRRTASGTRNRIARTRRVFSEQPRQQPIHRLVGARGSRDGRRDARRAGERSDRTNCVVTFEPAVDGFGRIGRESVRRARRAAAERLSQGVVRRFTEVRREQQPGTFRPSADRVVNSVRPRRPNGHIIDDRIARCAGVERQRGQGVRCEGRTVPQRQPASGSRDRVSAVANSHRELYERRRIELSFSTGGIIALSSAT